MTRASGIVRQARQALQNSDLLKILRSEISNELSTNRFNEHTVSGSIGQFAIEHDSRDSQDVVLRSKFESGEEVVVSALLSKEVMTSDEVLPLTLPRQGLMKVCVRKPGVSSILQFNVKCGIFGEVGEAEMHVLDVFILPFKAVEMNRKVYRSPGYETLDKELKIELNEFLRRRGVDEGFSNWLLVYLHKKEQDQYVDWLRKIETFATLDVQAE